MQAGFYVGLSAQIALRKRLDAVAHNIANAGTAGFRAEQIRFETRVAARGGDNVAFASAGDTYLSRQAGGMTKTNNPLDFAVSGEGWLAFQGDAGPVYTRDGRFEMAADGALLTLKRRPVLDAGGTPIVLEANAGPPIVSRDGMITQGGRQIGAIGLFSIPNDARLRPSTDSGFMPDRPASPILSFEKTGLVQGFSEGSNVNPVVEITRLIEIQRAFDTISAGIEASEATMTEAIKTLGGGA